MKPMVKWEQIGQSKLADDPLTIRKTNRLAVPKGWILLIEYFIFDSDGKTLKRFHTETVRIDDAKHQWDLKELPAIALEQADAMQTQYPAPMDGAGLLIKEDT